LESSFDPSPKGPGKELIIPFSSQSSLSSSLIILLEEYRRGDENDADLEGIKRSEMTEGDFCFDFFEFLERGGVIRRDLFILGHVLDL